MYYCQFGRGRSDKEREDKSSLFRIGVRRGLGVLGEVCWYQVFYGGGARLLSGTDGPKDWGF